MKLEKHDIQGIVFTGYPNLRVACYVLLELTERVHARAYLQRLAPLITPADQRPTEQALQIAVTHAGLRALGLGAEALATFPSEFVEGMAGSDTRQRVLGDTRDSAPSHWIWGGPDQPTVHLMLMLYAKGEAELASLYQAQRTDYQAAALREIYTRQAVIPPDQKEHFGFRDGLSQPRIIESGAGSGAKDKPGTVWIKPGEFVLGYRNEYDKLPISPTVPADLDHGRELAAGEGESTRDLGRNGSYLVVRQLVQNVERFWEAMHRESGAEDGAPSHDKATLLAAKCVGRWPTGTPLALAPEQENPAWRERNDFGYRADPGGLACPIGSHIRRANPRDSLEPGPDDSAKLVKRHRLLRRGRSYGPRLAPFEKEATPKERGLFFISINANIRRQFEFVQQTWLNNDKFDGLHEGNDPLFESAGGPGAGSFTIPGHPVRRRLTGLSGFVDTRGGQYFFLPGLAALRFLGRLAERKGA